jgi:hypothetical protein
MLSGSKETAAIRTAIAAPAYIAGLLHDKHASDVSAFYFLAAACLASAVLLLLVRLPMQQPACQLSWR